MALTEENLGSLYILDAASKLEIGHTRDSQKVASPPFKNEQPNPNTLVCSWFGRRSLFLAVALMT